MERTLICSVFLYDMTAKSLITLATVANATKTAYQAFMGRDSAAMAYANTNGNAWETLKKGAITTLTAALSIMIMFAASKKLAKDFLSWDIRTGTGFTMNVSTGIPGISEQKCHDSPYPLCSWRKGYQLVNNLFIWNFRSFLHNFLPLFSLYSSLLTFILSSCPHFAQQ